MGLLRKVNRTGLIPPIRHADCFWGCDFGLVGNFDLFHVLVWFPAGMNLLSSMRPPQDVKSTHHSSNGPGTQL